MAVAVTVAVVLAVIVEVMVGLALQYFPQAIAYSSASVESRGQTLENLLYVRLKLQ